MSKLRDAIQIQYDASPLSPWGKRIVASATVRAETVLNGQERDGVVPLIVEDLKRRIMECVYSELIGEMQHLRHHIYDLQVVAGPGGHVPAQKAMDSWKLLADAMR